MAAMYTEDVAWRLPHSLPPRIAGPHVGWEAVTAFNQAVFAKFYEAESIVITILDELGDDTSSVVRFNMKAKTKRARAYDVEYVLFAKARGGKIHDVVELLDTHASNEQHQGNRVGVPPGVD